MCDALMYRRRKGQNANRNRAQRLASELLAAWSLPDETAPDGPEDGDASWQDFMRNGAALARQGRFLDAARCFCRASSLRPDHIPTMQQLGGALLRAGDPERALAWFDEALSLAPRHPGLLHAKGLAHAALDDRGLALAAFRCAVAIDADTWKSWQSIADITPEEGERLDAIAAAADALRRACHRPGALATHFAACAAELIHARRCEEAVRFIEQNFQRFAQARAAHDKLASASYHRGAFRDAFLQKQQALRSLQPDEAPPAPGAPRFDPAHAVTVLKEIIAILEAAGLEPFLAAGTLLGFMREGRPLPHDRDIDIGLVAGARGALDVASLIREHPRLMLARNARAGDRYFGLLHDGVGVDIFLHTRTGDHLVCGLSHWPGDIQWRFSGFDLRSADFNVASFRIPSNVDRYLAESYGPTWRSPDKGFASVLSSPALFEVDDYARAFYSAARAEKHLLQGDRTKAAALIAQSPVPIDFVMPAPLATSQATHDARDAQSED